MIRLNCIVPVVLTHKFLPKMVERKKGGVIFLSSTSAYQATPYFTVYSATKVFNLYLQLNDGNTAVYAHLDSYNEELL